MSMVRSAAKNDVPKLVEWMGKLVSHVRVSSADPYVWNLQEGHEKHYQPWFEKAIDSADIAIYVAEHNHAPVGFVLGIITAPFIKSSVIRNIGQIELCWVDALYRKQGIAADLVRELENWFKQKNIVYVDLQYLMGNMEAELTWKQLGYLPYRVTARKRIQ